MNHTVQITICSTQHDISDETTETVYCGNYRFIGGKHIISYDEYYEEDGSVPSKSTNLLKIEKDMLQITKRGTIQSQMLFRTGKKYNDIYRTPFGSFDMEIQTEQLDISENDNQILATIRYTLAFNHAPVSKCTIQITIH